MFDLPVIPETGRAEHTLRAGFQDRSLKQTQPCQAKNILPELRLGGGKRLWGR